MASWIFFGLAWLSLLINHSIDILERLNNYFKHKWGRQMHTAEADSTDTQVDQEDKIKKPPLTQ